MKRFTFGKDWRYSAAFGAIAAWLVWTYISFHGG